MRMAREASCQQGGKEFMSEVSDATISVVLIDDSKEIISVIEDLLGHIGPFDVVARLGTENEGMHWLEGRGACDLAIIDLVLRDGSGFNLIYQYRERFPKARILVLRDYATTGVKVRCVELGADAVFTTGEVKAFSAYLSRYTPQ
jgi:two-component system OmpR family response regulator